MEKMAGEGDEEMEYESDPEEAKMSLKMRRREASDDEEEEDEEEEEEEREREVERRRREAALPRSGIVDTEGESDGQGAAADYDDEEDEEEEEEDVEEYYDEQEEYEVEGVIVYDEYDGGEVGGQGVGVVGEVAGAGKAVGQADESGKTAEDGEGDAEGEDEGGQGEEEKKENEPFAVPTTGAFYMHDDRFKDNAGGRHRRTFGGRKLWESKDERKWGHDKFEEMNTSDRHFEEGRRSSRGSSRGRGKARGPDRGSRGGRMRGYDGNNNQSAPPRDVRGRGPRRYQPSMKNRSETLQPHNRQSAKSLDKKSHAGSGRAAASKASLDMDHEQLPARKVASNLNSASPPFYPSASSNKDAALPQKKEAQAGNHSRNIRPSAADHNFSVPHSTSMWRGKNVIDSMGVDKLHINDPVSPASAKPLNNVHMQSSASPSVGAAQMTSRAQGRGVAPSGSSMYQSQTNNQVKKVSPSAPQVSQRTPVQSRGQTSLQTPGQQLIQRSTSGSQSSPPKAGLAKNTYEPGSFESPLEPSNSKITVAGKGKGNAQGAGRGALVYGGGPGGNMGSGDPNLPAFFPGNFMQFGGQHPGGIGVPAVGMAFPGYVAQPNGLGNSEMTWLPVLASAAGALGASYCNPYMAVDGSYNPRPTGQPSALPAPSKENNNVSKTSNDLKPQQKSDLANDEFSQRQNKPRRYSEMNFSQ